MLRPLVLILAALALVALTPRAAAAQAAPPEGGLKAYIDARQALEQKDRELRRALRQPSGDLKPLKDRIATGLGRGGPLDADAFITWHEQVRSSAALREQVEKELEKPVAAAGGSPGAGGAGAPTTSQSGIATPPPASGAPGPAPAGAGGPPPMGAGGPPPAAPAAPATSPK
jgi:hypothetical protein